jgi:hypothetical protein
LTSRSAGLSGTDEKNRNPACPCRRLGDMAEPGVQDAAVAVAAQHQQVEAVLGGVVAE